MTQIRLQRTGARDLVFHGKCIYENLSAYVGSNRQNRWHTLAIYEAENGQFVVHIQYHTQWQGDMERSIVRIFNEMSEVGAFLEVFDPTPEVLREQLVRYEETSPAWMTTMKRVSMARQQWQCILADAARSVLEPVELDHD